MAQTTEFETSKLRWFVKKTGERTLQQMWSYFENDTGYTYEKWQDVEVCDETEETDDAM